MYKLASLYGDRFVEHSYPPAFQLSTTRTGTEKIMAGVPGGDALILRALTDCIAGPFFLLYLLHTPRGEGESGRYQSPQVERAELTSFLARYSRYLTGDARHDIWVYSPSDNATIVWDRHNLIHGYGPIECYTSALRGLGFSEGAVQIPAPHEHYYRAEFDADAKAILSEYEWNWSALKSGDEQ